MMGLHPRLSFVLKVLVCLLLLGFVWQVAGGPEILKALGGAVALVGIVIATLPGQQLSAGSRTRSAPPRGLTRSRARRR